MSTAGIMEHFSGVWTKPLLSLVTFRDSHLVRSGEGKVTYKEKDHSLLSCNQKVRMRTGKPDGINIMRRDAVRGRRRLLNYWEFFR